MVLCHSKMDDPFQALKLKWPSIFLEWATYVQVIMLWNDKKKMPLNLYKLWNWIGLLLLSWPN